MGLQNPKGIWTLVRVWLAGTAIALAPLLLLEDMDFLFREVFFSPKFWPDWAAIPISIAVGVGAVTWVGLRRCWDVVPRLEVSAQRVTRHLIFFILSVYAVSKVLRTQFRVPYVQLDTPLGDVRGYMLAWRFFGYSHGHEVFVALGEWIGPALLLFWPTTTLGACITAVVMANVVVVNFTHDLPVQRFSSCLLALTLYLVFLDGRRLLDFFILNRSVPPRPQPAALIQSPWRYAAAKGAWMILALVYSLTYIAYGDSRPTPIAGAWAVQSGGSHLPGPWWAVYFERGVKDYYPGSIRHEAGGRPERFHYEMDVADRQLHMIFSNSESAAKTFHGSYELEDGDRLRLRGVLGEQTVDIRLLRKY